MTGYFQDIVDEALAQLDQKMRAAVREDARPPRAIPPRPTPRSLPR
jgi:hypothetical protein